MLVRRLIGAATLDPATFEEVEADTGATLRALGLVLAVSLAFGIGSRAFGATDPAAVIFFSALALMARAAWAPVTFEIGTRILPGAETRADVGQLLRTIGFATAPGLLQIFGVVPGLTLPMFVMTNVWMLAAMIVAVRQALDYSSTGRAVAVCGLGWALGVALAFALGAAFGPTVS
jgi:hypothetical protein